MELTSFEELGYTREKLRRLEQFHAEQVQIPAENTSAREVSRKSIGNMIDQLKEEIARFETRAASCQIGDHIEAIDPSNRMTDSH